MAGRGEWIKGKLIDLWYRWSNMRVKCYSESWRNKREPVHLLTSSELVDKRRVEGKMDVRRRFASRMQDNLRVCRIAWSKIAGNRVSRAEVLSFYRLFFLFLFRRGVLNLWDFSFDSARPRKATFFFHPPHNRLPPPRGPPISILFFSPKSSLVVRRASFEIYERG